MKPASSIIPLLLMTGILLAGVNAVFGFSTDSSSLSRSIDRNIVLTNSSVLVTAAFTNRTPSSLKGFYYVEQIPSDLEVIPLRVELNGQNITNCILESGMEGDVYPGFIPRRWILEVPPDFTPTNPIQEESVIEVVYAIRSDTPGVFNLHDFKWIGYDPTNGSGSFGHSEAGDRQILIFVSDVTPAQLSARALTNGFSIGLTGMPGFSYMLEGSENLEDWSPVATNPAPFEFEFGLDDGYLFDHYYFRGRPLP